MNSTFSHHDATRGRGRRLAFASAVSALALVGAVGLGMTHSGALAQLKAEKADSVQTPFGRAPLSFADIVERVKPAVVSIQVSNGAKLASNPKGGTPRGTVPGGRPRTARSTSSSSACRRSSAASRRRRAHAGAGLGLRHLARRLRGDQQSRHRRRQQDHGQLRPGHQVRGGAGRHRSAHRSGPAEDQGRLGQLPARQVRGQGSRASATGWWPSAIRSVSAAR